ncbi:hypothetical protein FRC09_018719 [Ceratobasidium sp. 395]|nr:hypothetical protein FRC09_018719 [Ceratobasidium sp. 395]
MSSLQAHDVVESWSLRSEVAFVKGKMSELATSNDKKSLELWISEQKQYLGCRETYSEALRDYLDNNKSEKEDQLSCLREAHASEVISRLRSLGWTNTDDMNFDGSADAKAWAALVYQPKILTDRVWKSMWPKLVSLLDKNRKRRLKRERAWRLQCICFKITDLRSGEPLACMKKSLQVGQPDALEEHDPSVSLPTPFPQEIDIGRWEVAQNLADTEFPVEKTAEMILEHDNEIWQAVRTWQRITESYFASLVRQQYTNTQLPKPQIVQDLLDESFHKLSGDAAILLRADSFFRADSGIADYAYSYGNALGVTRLEEDKRFSSLDAQLSTFRLHSRASNIARVMLQEMGRPDASFLEFSKIQRFSCGRCGDFLSKSWEEIVNHYLLEEAQWEKRKADFAKVEIAYNHTHVLTPQSSPLTRLLTHEEAAALRREIPVYWYNRKHQCILCDWAGVKYVNSRKYVIVHIQNVHGIAEPESLNHIRAKNATLKQPDTRSPNYSEIVW